MQCETDSERIKNESVLSGLPNGLIGARDQYDTQDIKVDMNGMDIRRQDAVRGRAGAAGRVAVSHLPGSRADPELVFLSVRSLGFP